MKHTVRAWLALLRLPNCFTAPGDPLAGALLAGAVTAAIAPVVWAALASLGLYATGLVGNDLLGADEDARERPDRPIPSGRITRRAAWAAALALNGLALTAALAAGRAVLGVAIALSLLVWAYNAKARTVPVLRPLVMGACRGTSLLLGAALAGPQALGSPLILIAAVALTVHVAAITAIASREVGPEGGTRLPPWLLVTSPLVLLAALGLLAFTTWQDGWPALLPPPGGFTLLLAAMAIVWSALWCGLLFGKPSPTAVRTSIAALVRGILLVQAALCACAMPPGHAVALGLLAAFPVASWVGAWIKGS